MSNGIDLITLALARKGGGVTPEELTEALALKQNKLTAGTNVTIQNNVISSNQPTAPNPNKLTFTSGKGTEAYDGSLPKMITLEKLNGATKDFVNSSIATNTAFFKGTFDSVAELPTTDVTNNDYAFVVGTDGAGNTTYTRYKYNSDDSEWMEEYVLNNSSFTADQWATIQSGLKDTDKTQIETNKNDIADLAANMPESPEDVNAQPANLYIHGEMTYDEESEEEKIVVTDTKYLNEDGTLNTELLFADISATMSPLKEVYFALNAGTIMKLPLSYFMNDGSGDSSALFETMANNTNVQIGIALSGEITLTVNSFDFPDVEDEITESSGDYDLSTIKAQKAYFQKKIDSSNKIPYSYISGTPTLATVATSGSYNDLLNKPSLKAVATSGNYNDLSNKPTIPTVPSNLVLGYSGTTSTASALKIVTCTQAQYDASSKSADTVYLIKS